MSNPLYNQQYFSMSVLIFPKVEKQSYWTNNRHLFSRLRKLVRLGHLWPPVAQTLLHSLAKCQQITTNERFKIPCRAAQPAVWMSNREKVRFFSSDPKRGTINFLNLKIYPNRWKFLINEKTAEFLKMNNWWHFHTWRYNLQKLMQRLYDREDAWLSGMGWVFI